jgi:hypothetical protein
LFFCSQRSKGAKKSNHSQLFTSWISVFSFFLAKKGRRKDQDTFAAWHLCEIPIKKTLAKKDNLSQVETSFFRAKAQSLPTAGIQNSFFFLRAKAQRRK